MAIAEKRELQFITVYIILMSLLGLDSNITNILIPGAGSQVYTVINFYFVRIIALMVLITWLAQIHEIEKIPPMPSLFVVSINFLLFFAIFYVFMHMIFSYLRTGSFAIIWPSNTIILTEAVISISENLIALVFLRQLLPWGDSGGYLSKGTVFSLKNYRIDYTLNYSVPNIQKMLAGVPAIAIITILHINAYQTSSNIGVALVIAFCLFMIMYFLKETFSFGSSEAFHLAYNLTVIGG
jgi:hypothetical protein